MSLCRDQAIYSRNKRSASISAESRFLLPITSDFPLLRSSSRCFLLLLFPLFRCFRFCSLLAPPASLLVFSHFAHLRTPGAQFVKALVVGVHLIAANPASDALLTRDRINVPSVLRDINPEQPGITSPEVLAGAVQSVLLRPVLLPPAAFFVVYVTPNRYAELPYLGVVVALVALHMQLHRPRPRREGDVAHMTLQLAHVRYPPGPPRSAVLYFTNQPSGHQLLHDLASYLFAASLVLLLGLLNQLAQLAPSLRWQLVYRVLLG
mmetsp:Transcript_17610/g.43985  ORF Transcript_17610/g.43985 Transcript_17610/m.43985 type:complete len:264 (+) Transcript_17610:3959-4750(+)